MDIDDSLDYDSVKAAILRKYDINSDTYRQKFRSLEVTSSESPKELYVKWIRPKGKTVEEIGEIIMFEQYLNALSWAPGMDSWAGPGNSCWSCITSRRIRGCPRKESAMELAGW